MKNKENYGWKSPKGILLLIFILGCLLFLFIGSIQSIYESWKCKKEGMIWFSSPPSWRGGPSVTPIELEPWNNGKYSHNYTEKYIFGYCVSPILNKE